MEIQRCNVWSIRQMNQNPGQTVTVFAWSLKKHAVLHYLMHHIILDAFHQVLHSVGLIGSSTCWNCLVFQKELIIEDSLPIPPYTQHHLLWMKTGLWCGWWWFISLAPRSLLFHIIVQYPLFITRHNLFQKWSVFITFKWRITCRNMVKVFFA